MSVDVALESSILAFSAASRRRWRAMGSLTEVDAFFSKEVVCHPVDDDVVEVVAAEVCVAVGGFYFEYAVAEFEDGNIELPPPRSKTAIFMSLFALSRP